jgi:hypothetical protein
MADDHHEEEYDLGEDVARKVFVITVVTAVLFVGSVFLFVL